MVSQMEKLQAFNAWEFVPLGLFAVMVLCIYGWMIHKPRSVGLGGAAQPTVDSVTGAIGAMAGAPNPASPVNDAPPTQAIAASD